MIFCKTSHLLHIQLHMYAYRELKHHNKHKTKNSLALNMNNKVNQDNQERKVSMII